MFFAFVMLTEPMTTPPTNKLQIIYGILTGILFSPDIHFGSLYFTPELALVAGNIFSYAVSPKYKLIMKLKERNEIAAQTYDFVFTPDKMIKFQPGQYIEATLAHAKPDNRGIRRFFTIASSPSEKDIRLGIKFYDNPSTFKETLLTAPDDTTVVAAQLAGDFYLPKNKKKKLVFIAGGIGITPFRSMIKSLIDSGEKRDIIMFYGNAREEDLAYREILSEAEKKSGLKIIYSLTDKDAIPSGWQGIRGRISADDIKNYAPDFREREFFISGPPGMVDSYKNILKQAGVKPSQLKVDFFPGFA
jgi:ferredoxin-NADP reductase